MDSTQCSDRIINLIESSLGDFRVMGGPGSGNWGHRGRKGKRGGSAPSRGGGVVAGGEAYHRLKELGKTVSNPQHLTGEYGDPDTYMMGSTTTAGQTLQEAARREFGGSWVYRQSNAVRESDVPSTRQSVKQTYLETQGLLAEAGIEQVELYRGMALPGSWGIGDKFEGEMNPISSWTSRKDVAEMFAITRAAGTGEAAVVLESTFPAGRIFMSGASSEAKGMDVAQEWLIVGSGNTLSTAIDVR